MGSELREILKKREMAERETLQKRKAKRNITVKKRGYDQVMI